MTLCTLCKGERMLVNSAGARVVCALCDGIGVQPESKKKSVSLASCLLIAILAVFWGMLIPSLVTGGAGRKAATAQILCEGDRRAFERELTSTRARLKSILDLENNYATVLYDPTPEVNPENEMGKQLVVGALSLLTGMPLNGLLPSTPASGPKAAWAVQGKLKPTSTNPSAKYYWMDLRTKKTEGPFQPEAPK